jgi:cobalt-precorrin-5B (C1)-methyltransferase
MLDETQRYDFSNLLIVGHPGKLAKLTAGEWDTHSGSSQSAVPIVTSLASELFGFPIPSDVTVVGVFGRMSEERQSVLARALSGKIRECVREKLRGRLDPAVALVNMRGEILGTSGDLSPWN